MSSSPPALLILLASLVAAIIEPDKPSLRVSPLDNAPLFQATAGSGQSMPKCETACLEHFTDVLHMLFTPGNVAKTRETVCERYKKGEECMRPLTHCSDALFPLVTSGIRYMCVEQKNAFDVLLDCIELNSPLIRRQCDMQCNPESLVAGLAVKDTVMQTLDTPLGDEGVNMKQIIEPHLGRIAFSEGCRIAQCLLNCYKTKYNMMCEGTAGTLIMEMLSRPFSSEKEVPLGTQILSTFFHGFLPHTCAFISDKKTMRIDPELDAEIGRMYANRRRPTTADYHSFGQPVADPHPYHAVGHLFEGQTSPLEDANLLRSLSRRPIELDEPIPDISSDSDQSPPWTKRP